MQAVAASAPRPPSRDAYLDEDLELPERSPADVANVIPGATDVRVQLRDQLVEAEPRASRDPTELVLGSAERLVGDVEKEPPSRRIHPTVTIWLG